MTSVNVTAQNSTVSVSESGTTVDVASSKVATVEAVTAGASGLAQVNGAAKVSGSVVYYDGTEYKADATWTTSTLTDGGNF